ncbi:hypothetical protein DJ568_05790 [Mucilaginibacter hurinus]|uniref:Uncharacterized protein n=1 Tax=Mucilaginibacter hurinus TaxID=2201324 RepID=A0A367GS20_9SPHI|nr:hypothetical protein [Mucilaginibacter hurinus]RCH56244.1 hypothetical protein DJ568_05790 [Mucilaginibacter hurinus]
MLRITIALFVKANSIAELSDLYSNDVVGEGGGVTFWSRIRKQRHCERQRSNLFRYLQYA